MDLLKNTYIRGVSKVGASPSFKKDWRWILIASFCLYAISLLFRLSFADRWDNELLWVNGERILATHDAYFWLAKASGVGYILGYPLARLTAFIHDLTGSSFGDIGFYGPAFLGALVSIVCYLWGWLIGGRNAGIFAGVVGSLTPGFFYRSRLGYFDTDLFTLLSPMLIAWLLAFWTVKFMKPSWFVCSDVNKDMPGTEIRKTLCLALCFGLLARGLGIWHHDIVNMSILLFWMAVGVVLISCRGKNKSFALLGLSIYLLAAFPGAAYKGLEFWPLNLILSYSSTIRISVLLGLVVSGGLCFFLSSRIRRGETIFSNYWVSLGLLFGLSLITGVAIGPLGTVCAKLSSYIVSPVITSTMASSVDMGPIYPSILQSVIEAKLVPLSTVLERGAFFPFIGGLALFCMLIVVLLRPAAIFLLPFILLQVASIKMGVRFSMFGGAAMMIFLGVFLAWTVRFIADKSSYKNSIQFGVQVACGLLVLVFLSSDYRKIPITPVISQAHAQSLVELKSKFPAGNVWTWWDWGYATQYYAGMKTEIDGGRHAGRDIYPVAFSMATHSFEKSNAMIAYCERAIPSSEMGSGIADAWDKIPRANIMSVVNEELSKPKAPFKTPQYFVVSWNDMTVAKWITYFGNWNLESGITKEANTSNHNPGQLGFNIKQGAIMTRSGGGGLVSSITLLEDGNVDHKEFYMNKFSPRLLPKRRHLLINKVSRQSVAMDRLAYRSVMTRLLTGAPDDPEINKYFKLVVDKLPFARIYEVVQ